jgi:deoxyribodipyrimidine photo-lyase
MPGIATRKCPRSQVADSAIPDDFFAASEGSLEAVMWRILPQMSNITAKNPAVPDTRPALVWLRRDLRLTDHAALYHALRHHTCVYVVFVFDRDILDPLPRQDRRVEFIRESLVELDTGLRQHGGALMVLHGQPRACIPALARELDVSAIYSNRDYEPTAVLRDRDVAQTLAQDGIGFHCFKDQVIFECDEVLTQAGKPFTVFTPYKNAWLKKASLNDGDFYVRPYPVEAYLSHLAPIAHTTRGKGIPTLSELGFEPTDLSTIGVIPGMRGGQERIEDFFTRIDRYKDARDFPAIKGVSYLSVHLRFGTVSIRQLAGRAWREGSAGALGWLSELIWRDFYFAILHYFPHAIGHAFKPAFDAVSWDHHPDWHEAWCGGATGYPLVDAAQRQLLKTGWMHNRLRMVSASFYTKDLGLDWRHGEAWFAQWLLDFDLSANNGGWQWSASTGCDAQPWFRIFNPVTQSERFDPQGKFIRRYVPELTNVPDKYIHAPWTMPAEIQANCGVVIGRDYPAPIVDHAEARQRTLARFKQATGDGGQAD